MDIVICRDVTWLDWHRRAVNGDMEHVVDADPFIDDDDSVASDSSVAGANNLS